MSLMLHLLLAPVLAAPPAAPPPAPIKVMIVGSFHMANPGRDLHNVKVDDMLAPKRQTEIAALTSALARFQPTRIAVERPADWVAERYAKYLAGTLPPSRDETVQLGFRLAKLGGLKALDGIDFDGDFPYEPVQAYAKAHGQAALLDQLSATTEASLQTMSKILAEQGLAATLRHLNDPAQIKGSHEWYRNVLRVGSGNVQPAADLLTGWYKRNFLICANLLQLSQPGDRVAVFYGAGHSFLLRQCVIETPGFELIEPNDYLPR